MSLYKTVGAVESVSMNAKHSTTGLHANYISPYQPRPVYSLKSDEAALSPDFFVWSSQTAL